MGVTQSADRSLIHILDRFDDTASNTPLSPRLPQLRSLNETLLKQQRYDVDIQTGKKLISPRGNLYKD